MIVHLVFVGGVVLLQASIGLAAVGNLPAALLIVGLALLVLRAAAECIAAEMVVAA